MEKYPEALLRAHLAAVHVGVGEDASSRMLLDGEKWGWDARVVDLNSVCSFSDYYNLMGNSFSFPSPVVDDHGLVDWLSDLEWLGEYAGHIVVFSGLDKLYDRNPSVIRALASAMPLVLDGMRSGGEGFHVVFVGAGEAVCELLLAALRETNEYIENASQNYASVNPSEPAVIIDYRE